MFVAPLIRNFVVEEWKVTHSATSFPLGYLSEYISQSEMKLDEDSDCLEKRV
jgi:hypothetical protein